MRVKIFKLERLGLDHIVQNDIVVGGVYPAEREKFDNHRVRVGRWHVSLDDCFIISPEHQTIAEVIEKNNWKDYFFTRNPRLYTYDQLYTFAKVLKLKNRSKYKKLELANKLMGLYFSGYKYLELLPPYKEEDAIKLCVPDEEGHTAFYSVVYEQKHYTGHNTSCHAGLRDGKYIADSTGAGKLVAIADYPEVRCKIQGESKRYADYIVNRSAFAKAFKTKDYNGKALLMNIQECSHNFIVIACIALRAATEFPGMAKSWCKLVDAGLDEHKAYFLSYFFHDIYSPNKVKHSPNFGGSHRVYEGYSGDIKDFATLVKGEFIDRNQPCIKLFKGSYDVTKYYCKNGNSPNNIKWLYEKLGKPGKFQESFWSPNFIITGTDAVIEACKKFEW